MVTVNNLKILKKIRNHKDGEVFFVKDENTAYVWNDEANDYIKVDKNMVSKGGLSMNLYEINKSIISQMKPLTDEDLTKFKDEINEKLSGRHYLMYGKEISYFTLFEKRKAIMEEPESLGEVVIDCLKSFEKVYSYELTNNNTYEIWVHNEDTNLPTVLYLFNYKDGIVYYE